MGRFDLLLCRPAAQVKGCHATLGQARVARITYDDFVAEAVREAVGLGVPQEDAHADPEGAAVRLGDYMRMAQEALFEDQWED